MYFYVVFIILCNFGHKSASEIYGILVGLYFMNITTYNLIFSHFINFLNAEVNYFDTVSSNIFSIICSEFCKFSFSISHLQYTQASFLHSSAIHYPTTQVTHILAQIRGMPEIWPPVSIPFKLCKHSLGCAVPALCNELPKDLSGFENFLL